MKWVSEKLSEKTTLNVSISISEFVRLYIRNSVSGLKLISVIAPNQKSPGLPKLQALKTYIMYYYPPLLPPTANKLTPSPPSHKTKFHISKPHREIF